MKTFVPNLSSVLLSLSLCTALLLFPSCNDDDEDDMKDDDPCEQMVCQNGGRAIRDVELGGCRCVCLSGFSGENCETQIPD